MEILLVSGIFPPDIGGPATYIPRLAESLFEAGESVKVITLSDESTEEKRPYPVYRILRKGRYKKRFSDVVETIAHQGLKCDLIFANGLFGEVFQANKVLKKPQVNKIVADYAWEVASRKNLTKLDMVEFNRQKGLVFNFLRRARNYPAVQANTLITPSNYLKNIVLGWGYNTPEIEVIPNGFIPSSTEQYPGKLPHPYLVCIGRLIPFKQVGRAIKMMLEMPAKYHLVIVGDGPLKNKLQQLTKKLDLEQQVHFFGRLSSGQTFNVLEEASAYLLLTTGEAFPHTVLEAMAASTPVISTDTGGLPEIITSSENGILVSSTDAVPLKETAMSLFEDSTFAKRLVAGGKETLENFSFGNCFDKTYEVIKKTAGV